MECNKFERLRVGQIRIFQLEGENAFLYQSGMSIDADGAPRAYHPEPGSNLGLDRLANAGEPGNWFGIVTDNGKRDGNPVVQGPDDLAPGFFVSPTSLQDKAKARTDPSRYVDSSEIPYIVLPAAAAEAMGAQLGDLSVVIRADGGRTSEAIFADTGPRGTIGEGSIALAERIGIPSSPRDGGAEGGIIYVVFPGSGNRRPRSADEIVDESRALFEAIGGMGRIQACFPDSIRPGPPVVTRID
jgi:hypothetical protein